MTGKRADIALIALVALGSAALVFFVMDRDPAVLSYTAPAPVAHASSAVEKPVWHATHVATPESVRAIYMTSWVAATKSFRKDLVKVIDETEVNAVVIDIKDYSGRIVFDVNDPELVKVGSVERRVPDMREFISELHAKGVYVIGRISSFQDAYLTAKRPELAVRRASDGKTWTDRKGISWLDAGSHDVWDYLVAIGKESYSAGFDELNFDYVRFPSDGNMRDIDYRFYNASTTTRADQMEEFFAYLDRELSPIGAVLSADLFGLTSSAEDDLGIGQVLERAAPYFDYIAPMIYPSHYGTGFLNFKNPADHPYEVILSEMKTASAKLVTASSTPMKLRPWLQDFNLGAIYTPEMIRAQKKAVYDAGLTSWMMWAPSNRYTVGALDVE